MKKHNLIIVLSVLLLGTLACGLPFLNPAEVSSPEEATEVTKELATQPTATTTATDVPEFTATPSEDQDEQVYNDGRVEITLPSNYILSADISDHPAMEKGLDTMKEWGGGADGFYEFREEDIILVGYDSQDTAEIPTSLLVMKNDEFPGIPLGLVAAFGPSMMGDQLDFLDSRTLRLGNRETVRFLTSIDMDGVQTHQAIYMFNEAGHFWILSFITQPDQLEARLSTFEAAVASFKVISVE